MTSSSDLEQIETRTLSLVRDFSFLHADDPVANSCKAVADAVAQQAVTSSEGGKRLRALLTLDAFRAFAPQDVAERDMDAVLDLACAIEVFQTGALVHDDIIDDSDLRRGKPSAHRALATDTIVMPSAMVWASCWVICWPPRAWISPISGLPAWLRVFRGVGLPEYAP